MSNKLVLIAGGGIGGLVMALTLHQIGVPCLVFESVREMKPLGVGINLQPNAVRELYDLGIGAEFLDKVGVPALIRGADMAYENPMIDRDPVSTWADGPVVLMGDAAHAMYPTGSNGASQAIVDARVLGQCMVEHGVTPEALAAYDSALCGPISQVILRNRGAGPFGLLNLVDERCGGTFENIDDVISPAERSAFMAGYKAAAGFAIEKLNGAGRTIAEGAKARGD